MENTYTSKVYDVIVVGAGIMGSCTAYQVAKRGKSVLLLEQFDFLHRRGSSHGESRTIRAIYPEAYYVYMMKEAFQLWDEAQDEAKYMVYTRTGHLEFGPHDNKSLLAAADACEKHEIPFEVLSSRQVFERFHSFDLPEDWIGLFTPSGGVLQATKAVAMFQHLASKHGAILKDRSKVTKIIPNYLLPNGEQGALVSANSGEAVARRCVLAAGAWTHKLVQGFSKLELPIEPLHTAHAYWEIENDSVSIFSAANGFPAFSCSEHPIVYGIPSLEYPGLIKINLHTGPPCDADNRSVAPDLMSLCEFVSPFIAKYLKGKVKHETPVIAEGCMYSMTTDGDFILDFLPLRSGEDGNDSLYTKTEENKAGTIIIAAGFSGHGFKMGPLIGRVMADLALQGVAKDIPLEKFSIERFSQRERYH